MKHILLFGAGKSATCLINYLKEIATENHWSVTVADENLELLQMKVGDHEYAVGVKVDVENEVERKNLVKKSRCGHLIAATIVALPCCTYLP
jgi:hypothetical protein